MVHSQQNRRGSKQPAAPGYPLRSSHRPGRYGDPKKMDANTPDAAFAALFRDQCAVKFLEAHAALLGRYAEVQFQPLNSIWGAVRC